MECGCLSWKDEILLVSKGQKDEKMGRHWADRSEFAIRKFFCFPLELVLFWFFYYNGVCVLSCVWLLCNAMDCSPPGSSVHGIFQKRILECIAISFYRGSSQPRDWTHGSFHVSCIAGRFFKAKPPCSRLNTLKVNRWLPPSLSHSYLQILPDTEVWPIPSNSFSWVGSPYLWAVLMEVKLCTCLCLSFHGEDIGA